MAALPQPSAHRSTSHAAPERVPAQWQLPSMHRPCIAPAPQSVGRPSGRPVSVQTRSSHVAPPHPASHSHCHVAGGDAPCQPVGTRARSPWWRWLAHSAQSWPSRQRPCPPQLRGQLSSAQSGPPQPSSHVHVPLMHTPWPLQPSGQSAYWQLGPWKPGLQ